MFTVLQKQKIFFFPVILIIASCLAVYGQSLNNGFVSWDDDSLVYHNPLVKTLSLQNVKGAFTSYDPELYIPLTILSYQIEHAMFGMNATVFHTTNLFLHILAGVLVFFLLRRLGLRDLLAAACALLFALHPMNVEAVAWISARKDLLSSVFVLGSVLSYLQYRSNEQPLFFWLSLAMFLLALLSKASALPLPLLLILLDWKEQRTINRQALVRILPFVFLSLLFFIIAIFGKTRNIESLSAFQTLLLSAKSFAFMVMMYVAPFQLSLIYRQNDAITLLSPSFIASVLFVMGTALIALWSLRRARMILFGILFFFLWLAPSFANFSKNGTVYFASDRYIYVAQIGVLILIGYFLQKYFIKKEGEENDDVEEFGDQKKFTGLFSLLGFAGFLIVLITAASISHARSLLWADSETLFRDALSKNDLSDVMHYNLGHYLHVQGRADEAQAEYERAISLNPRLAKGYSNLGLLFSQKNDRKLAETFLRRAIELDPDSAVAHNNLGTVFLDDGKVNEAIEEFRRAITLNARYAMPHKNLAAAYGRLERYEEGVAEFLKAMEIDPEMRAQLQQLLREAERLKR